MTLPLIYPTGPGNALGVISDHPRILQSQECGVTDDPETLGVPLGGVRNPSLVHILSSLRFHSREWTSGHTAPSAALRRLLDHARIMAQDPQQPDRTRIEQIRAELDAKEAQK